MEYTRVEAMIVYSSETNEIVNVVLCTVYMNNSSRREEATEQLNN